MENRPVKVTIKLLKIIGVGGLLVGGLVAPNAVGPLISLLCKRSKLKDSQIRTSLAYAQKQNLYRIEKTSKGTRLVLTPKGKRKVLMDNLESPLNMKKWDGKWRVIIFDIPTTKTRARNQLRAYLRTMGFKKLQASAWIIPYKCDDEITALQNLLGLSQSICMLEVSKINGESSLRRKFKL